MRSYWDRDSGGPSAREAAASSVGSMVASASRLWSSIQSSVSFRPDPQRAIGSTDKEGGLECSFVTPNLMSLGKFSDDRSSDLENVLHGQPFAVWNLSGRNFSESTKNHLKNQVLDAQWLIPGQFSQVPSIECIFNLCYSIKAWLDLHSEHVAVIHCQNGRSRSGILIACFLKYIAAFETTSHAFDFFCSTRAQADVKACLAPSYRILFDNMDRFVGQLDNSCRPTLKSIHLKSLSVSGLPVDEIPCVEVWDLTGQVYASHQSFKLKNSSDTTWSAEYGDGMYKVASDIIGDFSIMIRFGGTHAAKRDKSTIIFKYHNHTAMLLPEVLELRKQNVDVNPEYDDSLDMELFSVQLVLEACGEKRSPEILAVESRFLHRTEGASETDPFEFGLDEISKWHVAVPDPAKHSLLLQRGCPASYATVALQLSSNDIERAAVLVRLMQVRSRVPSAGNLSNPNETADCVLPPLSRQLHVKPESYSSLLNIHKDIHGCRPDDDLQQLRTVPVRRTRSSGLISVDIGPSAGVPVDADISTHENMLSVGSYEAAIAAITTAVSPAETSRGADPLPPPVDRRARVDTEGGGTSKDATEADLELELEVDDEREVGQKRPAKAWIKTHDDASSSVQPVFPPTISDDIYQYAPPTAVCCVCREDIFASRDQLVICTSCTRATHTGCFGGRKIPFSLKTAKERNNREKYLLKFYKHWKCAACMKRTVHGATIAVSASVARPDAIDASSALVGDLQSLQISSSPSPSLLVSANAEIAQVRSTPDHAVGQTRTAVEREPALFTPIGFHLNFNAHHVASKYEPSLSDAKVSDCSQSTPLCLEEVVALVPPSPAVGPPSPAAFQIPPAPALVVTAQEAGVAHDLASGILPNIHLSAEEISAAIKFAKYEKLKKAVPEEHVRRRMMADGIGAEDIELFLTPPKRVSITSSGQEMVGVGTCDARTTVEDSKVAHVPSSTALNHASTNIATTASSELASLPGPNQSIVEVPLAEHPTYGKFFKMLRVGVPSDNVRAKMIQESLDPKILDLGPAALFAVATHECNTDSETLSTSVDKTTGTTGSPTNGCVHPASAVSALPRPAMAAVLAGITTRRTTEPDCAPPSVQPPVVETCKASTANVSNGLVAAAQHPIYEKFFKMLKVGLPLALVQAKMQPDGADPKVLEGSPDALIPLSDPAKAAPAVTQAQLVALSEHPVYSKYFKMLRTGVPAESVKHRMTKEGADSAMLDRPPTDLVPLDTPPIAEDKQVASKVPIPAPIAIPVKRGPRKKRLYWKSLAASKVTGGTVWADDDPDARLQLDIDEEEFKMLFVESSNSPRRGKGDLTPPSSRSNKAKPLLAKKKVVYLIDMKRGQNASIALSRIKMSFTDLRRALENMDDQQLTVDQLGFIKEYLPTSDEIGTLKAYRGETDVLGAAERFMLEMVGFDTAAAILDALVFKKLFCERVISCETHLRQLEKVCTDVKHSRRLKKVMKTILKVGNQMNTDAEEQEESQGFSLATLLQLQNAKAFDKKTTILSYVILLLHRNDADCLQFPEDLSRALGQAAKIGLETLQSERRVLRQGLDQVRAVVAAEKARHEKALPVGAVATESGSGPFASNAAITAFIIDSEQKCLQLDQLAVEAQAAYTGLLNYFGEDLVMTSQDFLLTLFRFAQAFSVERDAYLEQKKRELRLAAMKRVVVTTAGGSGQSGAPIRRASTMSMRATSSDIELSSTTTTEQSMETLPVQVNAPLHAANTKADSVGVRPSRRGTIM